MHMQASVLDLRYKMRAVLEGLERGETITITHQGKKKGILVPVKSTGKKAVSEHAFFGMRAKDSRKESVEEYMKRLRKPRYAL